MKRLSRLTSELSIRMFPMDTNPENTVFGGIIFSYIDRVASVVSRKFTGGRTASVNINCNIDKPIRVGEVLVLKAKLIYAQKTSMVILIDIFSNTLETDKTVKIGKALVTSVFLDDDGNKKDVPSLNLTKNQQEFFIKMYNWRKKERALQEEIP